LNYAPRLAFEPLSQQRAHQSAALQQLLAYLQERSPFYRRLFAGHKADISRIRSVADLPLLPTTTKSDMQEYNEDFLCVPRTEIREYTATSGTLGRPVSIALTERDLDRLAYNEYQSFLTADGSAADLYQLMLTLDRQFMAGMAYYLGIRRLGATLVRTGPGLPAMQWDTIFRLQTSSIVAVPSFMLNMISYARAHQIDLSRTPIVRAVCIGESLRKEDFSLNVLGQKITEQWPLRLYSTYASTEMQTAFTECGAGQGGHEQPDLIILEILDDEGNPVQPGEYGEVTITTLGVEGMPLLRYRTGDICAFYDTPCSCGRHSRRISPVLGRKQQMIKFRGTTLYPPAIFDILNNISFVQEYVVEAFTGELGTDELRLHIHTGLPIDDCERQLKPILQSRLRVVPQLRFHSGADMQRMQFPPNGRKQVRFIDNRSPVA
jgi:phenylacetate-CoA ligase